MPGKIHLEKLSERNLFRGFIEMVGWSLWIGSFFQAIGTSRAVVCFFYSGNKYY